MRHSICRLSLFALFAATLAFARPKSADAQARPPLRVAQQPASASPNGGASQAPASGPANSGATSPGKMVPVPQSRPATPNGAQAPANGAAAAGAEGQWNPGVQVVPLKPRLPFKLTPEEEKELDETLKKWEEKSDKIQSFKCQLMRFEYDTAFGAAQDRFLKSESKGELKYKSPDHGVFHIKSTLDLVPQTDGKPSTKKAREATELDHWVCDGESIYELSAAKKQLIQHKLPKEMQGKAIADGPLPFVFGAKADQIKRRYLIRVITPKEEKGQQVWLEAWPKFQTDAANFQRVQVILTDPEFVPVGLQVFLPGAPIAQPGAAKVPDEQCSRTVYLFDKPVINDKLAWLKGDFLPPLTPLTWQKIVEEPESETPPTAAAPTAPPAAPQANRPATSKIR